MRARDHPERRGLNHFYRRLPSHQNKRLHQIVSRPICTDFFADLTQPRKIYRRLRQMSRMSALSQAARSDRNYGEGETKTRPAEAYADADASKNKQAICGGRVIVYSAGASRASALPFPAGSVEWVRSEFGHRHVYVTNADKA